MCLLPLVCFFIINRFIVRYSIATQNDRPVTENIERATDRVRGVLGWCRCFRFYLLFPVSLFRLRMICKYKAFRQLQTGEIKLERNPLYSKSCYVDSIITMLHAVNRLIQGSHFHCCGAVFASLLKVHFMSVGTQQR